MGRVPCQIIIEEGEIGLAISSILAKRFPNIEFAFLDAAIHASCEGTHQISLYLTIEGEDEKLTDEFTQPIIDLHKRIVTELPAVANNSNDSKLEHEIRLRRLINKLTDLLFDATRNFYTLFPDSGFKPLSLESVRHSLGIV